MLIFSGKLERSEARKYSGQGGRLELRLQHNLALRVAKMTVMAGTTYADGFTIATMRLLANYI